MSEKSQVLKFIEKLPESVSAETIITELQFRLMVLRRGAESERGEHLVPHEEAKHRLDKWLRSPGT